MPTKAPAHTADFLTLESLTLSHKTSTVLENISMKIKKEEIVCLLGPSGCGKTTLLRAIAGFITPKQGLIRLQGEVISHPEKLLPPAKRQMSMVFQDLALFPHLSVADNILISMKTQTATVKKDRLQKLVASLQLEHVLKKYPHTISGGEQQRTALARALAPQPNILLLDEPLASQDIELKQKLLFSLKHLLKKERITTLFVTHAQDEAFALADKIGVLHNHRLEQFGIPYEVYYKPCSRFIADFIGRGSLMTGLIEDGILITEFGRIKKFQLVSTPKEAAKAIDMPTPTAPPQPKVTATPYKPPSMKVKLLIRPDDVQLDSRSAIRAEILEAIFQGSHFLYVLKLRSGTKLLALMPSLLRYNKGDDVGVAFSFHHVVVFM